MISKKKKTKTKKKNNSALPSFFLLEWLERIFNYVIFIGYLFDFALHSYWTSFSIDYSLISGL